MDGTWPLSIGRMKRGNGRDRRTQRREGRKRLPRSGRGTMNADCDSNSNSTSNSNSRQRAANGGADDDMVLLDWSRTEDDEVYDFNKQADNQDAGKRYYEAKPYYDCEILPDGVSMAKTRVQDLFLSTPDFEGRVSQVDEFSDQCCEEGQKYSRVMMVDGDEFLYKTLASARTFKKFFDVDRPFRRYRGAEKLYRDTVRRAFFSQLYLYEEISKKQKEINMLRQKSTYLGCQKLVTSKVGV